MAFLGRLHILVIHFPIALLMVGTLLDWVCLIRRKEPHTKALFVIGVIGAWLACVTGWFELQESGKLNMPETQAQALWHLILSVAASVVFSVVLALRFREMSPRKRKISLGLAVAGTLLIAISAHLGATFTHDSIFG